MRKYEVWSEGFVCTGSEAQAFFYGTVEANSFQEACDIMLKDDPEYDSFSLSTWGCRLYDNEADARKFNG